MEKITLSPFISKAEKDFVDLCNKSNVQFIKDKTNRHQMVYTVIFDKEYIDHTEKQVVDYCHKHEIKYTTDVDTSGYHHYTFSKLVEIYDKIDKPYIDIQIELERRKPNPELYKHLRYDIVRSKYYSSLKWWQKLLCYLPRYKKNIDAKFNEIESDRKRKETMILAGIKEN
jgi:tRNA(Ile)-lysidine synthase TilS/MesJ